MKPFSTATVYEETWHTREAALQERLEDYKRLIRLRDKDAAEDRFIEEKWARREARRSGEFG